MSDLTFDEYQTQALTTAFYPGRGTLAGLNYTTLGLSGEAGEIPNKVKKIFRDDNGVLTQERKEAIRAELGDVLWYAALLAEELNEDLSDIADENLLKLSGRQERGTLTGSGDNR